MRSAAHRRLAELDRNRRRRRLPALLAAAPAAKCAAAELVLAGTPAGWSGRPLLLMLCLVLQGVAAGLWRVGKVEEQQGVVAAGGHAVAAPIGGPRGLPVQRCTQEGGQVEVGARARAGRVFQ